MVNYPTECHIAKEASEICDWYGSIGTILDGRIDFFQHQFLELCDANCVINSSDILVQHILEEAVEINCTFRFMVQKIFKTGFFR